jgi:hypothetical protein
MIEIVGSTSSTNSTLTQQRVLPRSFCGEKNVILLQRNVERKGSLQRPLYSIETVTADVDQST